MGLHGVRRGGGRGGVGAYLAILGELVELCRQHALHVALAVRDYEPVALASTTTLASYAFDVEDLQ